MNKNKFKNKTICITGGVFIRYLVKELSNRLQNYNY